jgi:Fe2+ transport system protein B
LQDHEVWVTKFENAAEQWLANELAAVSEQQQQTAVAAAQDESTQHVLNEVEKQNSKLQAMVTHYKSIIEDTVSTIFLITFLIYLNRAFTNPRRNTGGQ